MLRFSANLGFLWPHRPLLERIDAAAEAGFRAVEPQLMIDCYHMGRVGGDVIPTLERLLPVIGHVQVVAVPSRAEPDTGTLDYRMVFAAVAKRRVLADAGTPTQDRRPGKDA